MQIHHEGLEFQLHLREVVSVHATGPTSLHLVFDDGLAGELDLNEFERWTGVFQALRGDPQLFAQVAVHPETKVVCWPNDVDMDSDVLHARLVARLKMPAA